mmetsp:Transcript_915/g.1933  ORF Transcript_915/g.1933 Transcript_915/m.1933 type:complete len:632 (-) Transcript_915:352-2247(-)|eukprot:CAMPEP_0197189070 /NCGR_PEP_ID=MMETSP1423-20130617/19092_1 /TAXON_ID=476441 /ORGANISM="Pseudo-nitzschia heimii, Strain UNC1101" /LENGTH=631 /DNA_ID=CAMNT_0042641087 /DNA_START=173 /DNA_END=2068 /DNA_ORIENTATION=-
MQYSNLKKNDASGVPSLFACTTVPRKHKSDTASYLNNRPGKYGADRRKANILAMVDGAIEDGATEEAKQKASAERVASEAPFLGMNKSVSGRRNSLSSAEKKSTPDSQSNLEQNRQRSKSRTRSTDRQRSKSRHRSKSRQRPRSVDKIRKAKESAFDSEKSNNSFRSSSEKNSGYESPKPKKNLSVPPNFTSKNASPHTPAWKARLYKHGKNSSNSIDPEPKPSPSPLPSPKLKSKSPKPGKKVDRKKDLVQAFSMDNASAFELPLSRDDQPFKPQGLPSLRTQKPRTLAPVQKTAVEPLSKKGKKEKKKKKKKSKENPSNHKPFVDEDEYSTHDVKIATTKADFGKVNYEESESTLNTDDLILRNTQTPTKSDAADAMVGTPRFNLRKKVEETQKQLDNVAQVSRQEVSDLGREFANTKESIRFRFMKDVHAQGKKNDAKHQEYKKVFDEKQKEIDELRSANQKLRTTIQKLPKQMSEVIFSNHTLEEANEEVAGHIGGLEKFSKKLQADQARLIHSSEKCKNEYLPRYRQQLWDSKQHLEAETKIRNLYRNCIIKITKQIEKSRQVDLIEEISSMVLETEGEVNPKFDPKFLSSEHIESDDSSSSDGDDNTSSASSSSSSDSDSDSDYY